MFGKQIEKKDNMFLVSSDNQNELIKLKYNNFTNELEKNETISIPFNGFNDFKIFKDVILVYNENNNTFDIYNTDFVYLNTINNTSINNRYFLNNNYVAMQQSDKKVRIINIDNLLNSDIYSFAQSYRIDGANLSEYYFGVTIVEDITNENIIAIGSHGGKVKIYNLNESYLDKYQITGNFSENFGSSIVLDDDLIFIGAPRKSTQTGSVFIYKKIAESYSMIHELIGEKKYDYFGEHIEKNGDSIYIYSRNKSKGGRGFIGIYEYDEDESTYVEVSRINGNLEYKLNKNFIIVDGLVIVQDNNYRVLIFEQINNNWVLKNEISIMEHGFGEYLSFINNKLMIGSPYVEKVYIFNYDDITKEFNLSFEIVGNNFTGSYTNTNFGYAGALTENIIIVGAPNVNQYRGAFYIFDLNGTYIEHKEGNYVNEQVGFLINAVNQNLLFINAYGVN